MRAVSTNDTSLVIAAQAGDARALDELLAAYLPLVYTIVRRALGAGPDVDDIVQETLLRALRELHTLRSPESFRPWLVTIAMRQVSTYHYRREVAGDRAVSLEEAVELPDAGFEGPTLLQLELSDQRRQLVQASRWLDPDDQTLLSLWWLEVAGRLTRSELAAALGTRVAHAGVRVQRMHHQLDVSRSLVAALDARPRCAGLTAALAGWQGVPSPRWRKRLARHIRSCSTCTRAAEGLLPPERLLVGFALLPVPVALSASIFGEGGLVAATAGGASAAALSGAVSAGGKAGGLFAQLAQALGAHPVAAAVAAGTVAVGGAITTAALPTTSPAPAMIAAPAVTSTLAPRLTAPAPSPTRRTSPPAAGPTVTASPNAGNPLLQFGPVSLESINTSGLVLTTAEDLGVVQRVDPDSDKAARVRATFEVVPGLADADCVSLRAVDGRYLRHASFRLRLNAVEDTELFRADATFCVHAGSVAGSVSFRSSNYPGAFLHHRGTQVWLDWADGSTTFKADTSFRPRQPLAQR